jgi:DNA-directed RNA polymerase subunit F
MTAPEFVEEKTVSLVDAKKLLEKVEKRDLELNYRSNKTKEFLDIFASILTDKQGDELRQKLLDLKLTRLRDDHITKIVDFLPTDLEQLKVVLQAYPLSMPKKDQEMIIDVVKGFA